MKILKIINDYYWFLKMNELWQSWLDPYFIFEISNRQVNISGVDLEFCEGEVKFSSGSLKEGVWGTVPEAKVCSVFEVSKYTVLATRLMYVYLRNSCELKGSSTQ